MATLALKVGYNGAPFCGFARQKGDVPTVQGDIERVLELLFHRPVDTVCAGRTDAGVHALGQVVSFDLDDKELDGRDLERLRRSLDALTHDSISIRELEKKPQGFSARFNAVSREYRYAIHCGDSQPLVMHDFCWHVTGPLDCAAMDQAVHMLIGIHDFKSFCVAASAVGKSTTREIIDAHVDTRIIAGEEYYVVTIVGTAFLHSMIRTIVGSLIPIGRGRKETYWMKEVLEARNRSAAGEKAPAQGLVFWHVIY
jgi:tRNA pseudouridine38-40 synthase